MKKLLIDFIDKTAPVIAIEPYTTTPTNQPITVNASVEDVGSGATLNATSHTFEENGSFTFTATDLAGNSTSETVTIDNIDKVAPVITLNDDATMYVAMDSTFTDPGATYDNGLSATVSGTVDTTKMSKYILTYSATDAAGNLATDVTRTVYVYPTDGTGLTGKYYDNLDFSNLKLIRTDETVNFDWVRGTPD